MKETLAETVQKYIDTNWGVKAWKPSKGKVVLPKLKIRSSNKRKCKTFNFKFFSCKK
jgi:hypothetical protein